MFIIHAVHSTAPFVTVHAVSKDVTVADTDVTGIADAVTPETVIRDMAATDMAITDATLLTYAQPTDTRACFTASSAPLLD
jgi:hypothetical protein